MNALTMNHGLSNAALNGEDILRALIARDQFEPFATQSEIASATGRAPKNIGRDIGQLQAAELVLATPPNWSVLAVTEAGHAAIAALDKAAGQGATSDGGGLIFVPAAQLDDNPLNPRKVYDADDLETLADTIEDKGKIIQPLSVSPVQPNGRRFIWAGHRRQRAQLIVEARFATRGETLPHTLAQGVPCVEDDADPAASIVLALIENGAREDTTPWEDAQAFAKLEELTGWSGRHIARVTGRARRLDQGDETGVRDVQEKIKVARTAPADLVEAHEAGLITWEQFRGALRTGKLPTTDAPTNAIGGGLVCRPDPTLTQAEIDDAYRASEALADRVGAQDQAVSLDPHQRLVLLEIRHASLMHPDRLVVGEGADQVCYAPTGKYWLDLTASTLQTLRLIDFKHVGRPYVRVTPAGLAWIDETYGRFRLSEAIAEAACDFGAGDHTGSAYVTDWLNPPPPTPAETASQQTTDDGETADVEDAVAAQLLVDAEAFVATGACDLTGPDSPAELGTWSDLLSRSGTDGPFTTDRAQMGCVIDGNGETVCVVDVDNALLDNFAQARAVLIAAALNRVCDLASTAAV